MHYKMHFYVILLCIFFMHVITSDAIPCDSCGNECASACGTKNFRTCCFNYLRKRTDPNTMKTITNKRRLIDFILLQGHAMVTLNELSKEREQERQQQQQQQQQNLKLKDVIRRNGTNELTDIGLQSYYDG